MKLSNANETDVRSVFSRKWTGWRGEIENGRGTNPGYPDVHVLVDGRLYPIEFKKGNLNKESILRFSNVRPAQVSWHTDFMRNGGKSFFIVGALDGQDIMVQFIFTSQLMLTKHYQGMISSSYGGDQFLKLPTDRYAKGKDAVFSDALKNFLSKY